MRQSVYDAALSGAIVVDRTDLGLVRVWGRDPVRMLHGLMSNDVQSLAAGHALYATLLTPKGRMLADPRIIRRADDLLLEADSAAITNIIDTFGRTVPPLFARVERLDGQLAVLGVYGPAAGRIIAGVMGVASHASMGAGDNFAAGSAPGGAAGAGDGSGGRPGATGDAPSMFAAALATVPVDDSVFASFGDAELILLRTDRASVEGWDIIVASDQVEALRGALEAAGAIPGDIETLDVLRVEAGRPRWGAELTEDVIPLEAGLMDRAISTTKGCYTGQEVIIRILHRGHVNRHLRGLRLVSGAAAAGQELFHPEIRPGKPVGTVTSAASSPRLGAIALGYVRREIEPGATVHVGSPDGPHAAVVELPFRIPD